MRSSAIIGTCAAALIVTVVLSDDPTLMRLAFVGLAVLGFGGAKRFAGTTNVRGAHYLMLFFVLTAVYALLVFVLPRAERDGSLGNALMVLLLGAYGGMGWATARRQRSRIAQD